MVKLHGLLPKPIDLRFTLKEECDAYFADLEALLDQSIVPAEFTNQGGKLQTAGELIDKYLARVSVKPDD